MGWPTRTINRIDIENENSIDKIKTWFVKMVL
jgi:hypothetical protein